MAIYFITLLPTEMTNKIDFTIILPTYNSEKTVKRAIESVTKQLKDNYQLIIIDDNSNDNTYSIISNLAKYNNNIHVFKNKYNMGPSESRNLGLDLAKGNFICFLDADDFYSEGLFAKLKEEIISNYPDVVKFSMKEIYENRIRQLNHPYFISESTARIAEEAINMEAIPLFGYVTNCAYRSEILKLKQIRFDKSIRFAEDFFFNYSVFRVIRKFSFLDFLGYNYSKQNKSSLSEKKVSNYFSINENKIRLLLDWAKDENCLKECQNAIAKIILKTIYSSTSRNIKEFEFKKAYKNINKIIYNEEMMKIVKGGSFNNKKLKVAKFPIVSGSASLIFIISFLLTIVISLNSEIVKKI